ncbi:DUF3857 domain-containing protein [Aridibaculum aurantiacum]|uniref:DUF3857 domain-containing protein n=1 Tax=Aridibaculum aurantiacum TaxID=2810307 RepID=UPI001A9797B2|nr:DUF3857 domain-containing protein [Aridibaculum aurantiacum]
MDIRKEYFASISTAMKSFTAFLLTCFLFVVNNPVLAQNKKVTSAPMPSWVVSNPVNYNVSALEKEAEDGYFDMLFEKQVNVADEVVYIKKALKILNESGVENASEVSVGFNPAYQQLAFHAINIKRGNEFIDKLQVKKFKVLQQETDAYRHLYDGNLTALLLLDDVRKGDVIEFSYSIKGTNPILDGKYADFFDMGYSVPVGSLYYRVLSPVTRPLYVESIGGKNDPVVVRKKDNKEYVWSLVDVAPVKIDANVPSWYQAFPLVSVSEYNDWHDVRKWANSLFPTATIGAPLKKKIDAIKSTYINDADRAAAALRFVQDDIRYLGIEMGVNSYKPAEPNKVFAQRYGDCKDKCYLLVTMLQAMGIQATPVMVNSSNKKGIYNWLPSPKAFDHVTVRMTVNGAYRFVDPTNSYQRGPLQFISYPDYQAGLVLADSTVGLTALEAHEPGKIDVKEIFAAPDKEGTVRLTVVTKNSGSYADAARAEFATNSLSAMQKNFTSFYAAYFEAIKADSINYKDDEVKGSFTVYEYYSIKDFWQRDKEEQLASFSAYVINSYLKRPKEKTRDMPMYIGYPARYKEFIEVTLPEEWQLEDFNANIRNSAFSYRASSTVKGNKLLLLYEYETHKDFLSPGEVPLMVAALKQIDEKLGWQVTTNDEAVAPNPQKKDLSPVDQKTIYRKLAIFFLLLTAVVIFFIIRHKRNQRKSEEYYDRFNEQFQLLKNKTQDKEQQPHNLN